MSDNPTIDLLSNTTVIPPAEITFDPVKRESIRDKVSAAIREAILSGKLKVGQRLTEAGLTTQFQVSRAVVREALQQLAHEGLIELNSYRGAQVIDLKPEQVDDIIQLRLVLESEAVRLAKQNMTDAGKTALRAAARDLERHRGNMEQFSRLDFAFHQLLWKMSGNSALPRHLVLLTGPVFSMGVIMRHRSVLSPTGANIGDHAQLAETICNGTTDQAVAAIRAHITENWARTRAAVGSLQERESKPRRRRAGR